MSEENEKSDAKPDEISLRLRSFSQGGSSNSQRSISSQKLKFRPKPTIGYMEHVRVYLTTLVRFLQKQSYLLSLISMMVKIYIKKKKNAKLN